MTELSLYLFSNYGGRSDSRMIHLIVAENESVAWQILEVRNGIEIKYLKEAYNTKLEQQWLMSSLQQGELMQMISWKTSPRFPEFEAYDPPGTESSVSIRGRAQAASRYFNNPLPM